jgi:phosphorylcholine metabolism protein LicD
MKFYLLVPIFFFISCKDQSIKIPKEIFPKETMISILVDIHIADAVAKEKKLKDIKLSNQLKKTYFNNVLEKHNITKEDFEKSTSFYENNIELMQEIYEKVMIVLSEKEALLNGEKNKPKTDKKTK